MHLDILSRGPWYMHSIVKHPTCQGATTIRVTSSTQPSKQTELQTSHFN